MAGRAVTTTTSSDGDGDSTTPVAQTDRDSDALVRAGRIRHIDLANSPAEVVEELMKRASAEGAPTMREAGQTARTRLGMSSDLHAIVVDCQLRDFCPFRDNRQMTGR